MWLQKKCKYFNGLTELQTLDCGELKIYINQFITCTNHNQVRLFYKSIDIFQPEFVLVRTTAWNF